MKREFEYERKPGDPSTLDLVRVPEGAVRCVMRGRHSKPVGVGEDMTRTLTEDGLKLALACRPYYDQLVGFLRGYFGNPCYVSSELPRSILTTFLATGAEQIYQERLLNLTISTAKVRAPEGDGLLMTYAKEHGWTWQKVQRWLAEDMSRWGDQPVDVAIDKSINFVCDCFTDVNLVVTFDHEPSLSVTMAYLKVNPQLLGVDECQAVLFFLDKDDQIISIQRFNPPPTVK